jgi:chitin disaccharide deacetylase
MNEGQSFTAEHRLRGRSPSGSRILTHADDFGETQEITRGICAAIEAGTVTSTSIMANMAGTEDALPRVAALAERASFGVHLNLCEGTPLTPGPTLVDAQGQFVRKRTLFARAMTGKLASNDVEAEVYAQIARVHDAGVRISHLDGHKHLHQLPVVAAAVARALGRFGIERVRVTRLRRLSLIRAPSTLVRELLAVPAGRIFAQSGLRSPVRVVDLQAIMLPGANAAALLREPRGPVEIFCHPGTELADQEKPGSCERYSELRYLLSDRFRELVETLGLRLINYWDI